MVENNVPLIPWDVESVPDEYELLNTWLEQQIGTIDTKLASKRESWTKYISMYRAQPDTLEKTFPWPGAANVFLPELHSRVQSAISAVHSGQLSQRPMILGKGKVKRTRELAENAAEAMDFYIRVVQEQPKYWRKFLPFWALLGTHVTKLSSGPKDGWPVSWPLVSLNNVPLHRFVCLSGEKSPQEASLIGDVSFIPFRTLASWRDAGYIDSEKFDHIVNSTERFGTQNDVFEGAYYETPGVIPPRFTPIYDIYCYWSSVMGEEKPLRVVWSRLSNTVLWHESWDPKNRPYVVIPFIPDETSIFGIGWGDLGWTLQKALNTNINQGIDSATIANTRVWVASPSAPIEEGEKIYPGKIIKVDPSMIRGLAMGDLYPSHWANQRVLLSGLDRALVNENFMGLDSSVARTRQTGMGQALNIQGMMVKQSVYILELEEGVVEILWKTIKMLSESNTPGFEKELYEPSPDETSGFDNLLTLMRGEEKVGSVDAMLNQVLEDKDAKETGDLLFDTRDVYDNRGMIEFRLAKSTDNQQVERQSAMVLSQLIRQYIQEVVQFAAQISELRAKGGMDILVETLVEGWKASNRMMKNVLAKFSVEDAVGLLISLQEVEDAIGQAAGGQLNGGLGAGQENQGVPGEENQGTPAGVGGLNAGEFSGFQGAFAGGTGGRPKGT